MVFRIIIAGETQCQFYAEMCLVADYLAQRLPNFCYNQIEKPVLEWETWLSKVNIKNNWHHIGSPIIWKEMLMKGGNAFYIGGAPEFLEYCHAYYQFDCFLTCEKFEGILYNIQQLKNKVMEEEKEVAQQQAKSEVVEPEQKTNFVACISGARNLLTMHLISALLDLTQGEKSISKIYIHDSDCTEDFMDFVETECSYVETNYPGKVVKVVDRIGAALTLSDLLIVLDHVPFNKEMAVGEWLYANREIMQDLALTINASASRKMVVIVANLGPSCYNATILRKSVSINKNNIVVATSDLGLEILPIVSEIAEVPMRFIFCPPVWGFVGVNHLVDVRTTVHKYNSFEPFNRYTRVRNSTLNIGSITPEMRTMEYLMYFDESLWIKAAEIKETNKKSEIGINKAIAVINVLKLWLFDPNPSYVINLGIHCDGSFGLDFDGVFSQPSRIIDGEWVPASDYMLPRDSQMKLPYLVQIAKMTMHMTKAELPKIVPFYPCSCKTKYYKKKHVW